jgi:hypothetical protein
MGFDGFGDPLHPKFMFLLTRRSVPVGKEFITRALYFGREVSGYLLPVTTTRMALKQQMQLAHSALPILIGIKATTPAYGVHTRYPVKHFKVVVV